MDWDVIEREWDRVKLVLMEKWGALSAAEMAEVAGQRDRLSALLQEKYGWSRSEADEKLGDFARRHDNGRDTTRDRLV
ncbi:CsbD family protein [Paracoccus aminophilus]|nr:hypothetical protein [Paracoccus aminophilus]